MASATELDLPVFLYGELAGRAQIMMKGYYKQDDKTRDLFWYDGLGLASVVFAWA